MKATGIATLVRRGTDLYAVPVPVLRYVETASGDKIHAFSHCYRCNILHL
jgi:hypothetical protein